MNKSNQKILYVTTKWLLPVEDGSRVATLAILEPLTKLNPEITYLALAGTEENININELKNKLPVKEVFIIKRAPHLNGSAKLIDFFLTFLKNPLFPISFSRYKLEKEITAQLEKNNYQLIIADGLHAAVPFLDINHPPLILREHNVENELWKKSAEQSNNIVKKLFFLYQACLVKKLETKIINSAAKTFAISLEDQKELSQLTTKPIYYLPVGQNFNSPLAAIDSAKLELLFLGKLDWAPNQEGLKWFLDEVWPKLNKARFHLTIAGSGNAEWLTPYQQESISLLGRIPDVIPAYHKAQLVIIPILMGSGTRIKVLEASKYQRPCLSTTAGIKGSPLAQCEDAFFLAESTQQWIKILETISVQEINTKGQNAFKVCKEVLEINAVAEKFYQEIKV